MTIDAATLEAIRVIDTDSHVIEPYDLWTSRVSVKRWGDKVPHVVSGAGPFYDVEDIWVSGDKRLVAAGMSGSAGHDKPYPDHPKRWSDLQPETWRAEDRLAMMTRYGIYAAVLYPNVAGFGA
ncbi:MAG TPA: hypothetical protein VG368_00545, partial [Acidimicrobiales bacterium]|nr:hypothetical protein [Acidimicrobiales bacterium]